jgi:hypothetical protein
MRWTWTKQLNFWTKMSEMKMPGMKTAMMTKEKNHSIGWTKTNRTKGSW